MPVVSNFYRKYQQRYFQRQERRRIEIEDGESHCRQRHRAANFGYSRDGYYSYEPNDRRGDHGQQAVGGDGPNNKETLSDLSGVDCPQRPVKESST